MTIRDDGGGFDPVRVRGDGREHVGIENVRSRLTAQCGGTLCIASQEGVGTVAQVRIPKTGDTQGKESFDADHRGG